MLGGGNAVSELFSVNVELRQGCVMSPWLFNIYIYIYIWMVWFERSILGFMGKD